MKKHKIKLKKIATILLAAVAFSAIQITAFAHETVSGIESSIEFSNWKLFESGSGTITRHNSGNGMYIVCAPSLISYGTSWEDYLDSAVNAWNSIKFNGNYIFSGKLVHPSNNTYTLTNTDISNGKTLVTIIGISNPDSRNWGATYFSGDSNLNIPSATNYSNSSGGYHLKTITIGLNMSNLNSKTATNKKYTITHELGHVIGLADLSTSFNDNTYSDCLMGYSNYTLTAPQPQDIKGAAVISGAHTNHSFDSNFSKINTSQHRNVCSLCDGYKTENHSYSTYNCGILGKTTKLVICKCGYATTNNTTSFAVPTLSSASNYKVVDGPLTIRTSASTAASSNGTMSNGQTVSISEIKLATNNSNYVMGKISSGTYSGKWIALGTVSGDVYAVNMSKQLIVLDGPLNVRNTASSSAQSYGTISNGSTFYITDATAANGFIFGKISSSAPIVVATGSTCNPNDASSHWVALDYCGSIW